MNRNKKKDLMGGYGSNMGVCDQGRFSDMFNRMYTLMDRAWDDWDLTGDAFYALQSDKSSLPKINIAETDDAYEVEIAISGFNKNDLELEFKDSCLFIKTENKGNKNSENKKWLRREISSRSSRRVVKFPMKVNSSEIESTYDENKSLVTCILPKVKKTEPEVIKIKID